MAKDFGGFQQDRRKCRTTGKPVKLMSQPATKEYRDNWERTFGKKPKKEKVHG